MASRRGFGRPWALIGLAKRENQGIVNSMQTLKAKRHERPRVGKGFRTVPMMRHTPKQTPEQAAAFERMVASAVDTGDKYLSTREGLGY